MRSVLHVYLAEMLDRMRSNFILESGTAIGNRIEAEVTWRMKKDGPALRSGSVVDQWQVLSDGDRYGTERFRQSPDGDRKTRAVYLDDELREFEFDLTASGETAVAGELKIRHQARRGPFIRLPLLDYLDRLGHRLVVRALTMAPEAERGNGQRRRPPLPRDNRRVERQRVHVLARSRIRLFAAPVFPPAYPFHGCKR